MTAAVLTGPAAIATPPVLFVIVLAVFGLICIAAMFYAIRETRSRFAPAERTQYLMIAGTLLAVGILLIDNRVDPYIAPVDRALITTPPEPPITLTVDLADTCPPQHEGMTSQVIMTIETRSDLQPLVTGCVRTAERSFVIKAEAGQ